MAKSVLGIHHITAIAGEAGQNIGFYTRLLEGRLDVNPGRDRKLASCRRNLARRHAEVFEQRLA